MPRLDRAVIASEIAEMSTPNTRANVGRNGYTILKPVFMTVRVIRKSDN
jgi:hypothetical protein